MRALVGVLRLLVAAATVTAVVGQLRVSIAFWTDRGDPDIGVDIIDFLSFFTIQSNLAAAVTLSSAPSSS